jgi:hypothetical protein
MLEIEGKGKKMEKRRERRAWEKEENTTDFDLIVFISIWYCGKDESFKGAWGGFG